MARLHFVAKSKFLLFKYCGVTENQLAYGLKEE